MTVLVVLLAPRPHLGPRAGHGGAEANLRAPAEFDYVLSKDGTVVAAQGRAAPALTTYAAESGAGFLALTTHGRTGLRRALLGSIAEEVLRNAPCPVLVRRAKGR